MESEPESSNGHKRLGEYKVIKNIGEGSFGHVKLAIHTLTDQKVALKYFSKARIKNMKLGARVAREIQYLRLLDHPHIIKIYEVINTATDIIMVIEFAGAELFDTLAKHGRLTEETARSIFQQLVSAVAHSHKYKVIHRDLKPENILIDWSGPVPDVKVIDFGLSNVMTDGDFLRTSCGSPCYACPEVISAKVYAGPEVDVWSMGVILYLMLAGRLPFEDENTQTLMDKICTGRYHMPNSIPPDAAHLIKNCIVVNPIKRLTIPEIMKHPWFLSGLPKYLSVAPQTPGVYMNVESLSYILAPPKDTLAAPGPVRPIPEVVEELAESIGVDAQTVIDSVNANGDNAIKVAYNIAKDKRLKSLDWHERMRTQEAVTDRGQVPTLTLPGGNQRTNYETDSTAYEDSDADEDWEFDWSGEEHNFAVLDSSLPPGQTDSDSHDPETYAEAQRAVRPASATTDVRKPHRTKWHFGIRSRSPPMEVMLELYNTLKVMGWEWREKPNLGKKKTLEPGEEADPRDDSDIFFLETRCRINDVVIRTDLQLYQVDGINYLVDFRNVGYYHASPDPETPSPFDEAESPRVRAGKVGGEGRKLDDITSPFLFLESACRLIQQLAGV
ncbi:Protein kinase [Ceratobasidium sp. UAMH 11750]|nr:Protein kinase [Ceratobasidium sp. UAMH 11750]